MSDTLTVTSPDLRNGTVRYESVMRLRNKLEELGKMEGVNTKEKGWRGVGKREEICTNCNYSLDPEEFLNILFKHTLHVDPFITIKYD